MQREAVATSNLIQQEAYSYAINTMAKNYKPTAREVIILTLFDKRFLGLFRMGGNNLAPPLNAFQ